MRNLIDKIKCWLGRHDWELSRFVVLGSRGPSYQCTKCGKVVNHD